jgi:hypothetical protein
MASAVAVEDCVVAAVMFDAMVVVVLERREAKRAARAVDTAMSWSSRAGPPRCLNVEPGLGASKGSAGLVPGSEGAGAAVGAEGSGSAGGVVFCGATAGVSGSSASPVSSVYTSVDLEETMLSLGVGMISLSMSSPSELSSSSSWS